MEVSSKTYTRLMVAGGVCKDELGGWLCGFMNANQGASAFVAKAVALRDGLQLAWDKGFRWIECEVDNLDLVNDVEDEELGRFVPEVSKIK